MVTIIKSKIITLNGSQKGDMCIFDGSFTFENLTTWVYRNCPGYLHIKINQKDIEVTYENRVEIYYIEKVKANKQTSQLGKYI